MLIYILLFLFILITGLYLCLYKNTNKNRILFLILNGILLVLISSLRYDIGYDYRFYKTMFYEISKTPVLNYKKELGFIILNKIIFLLGGNYTTFLFIVNSFMTFVVMRFIYKYSDNICISVFLYVTLQMFAHSMNLLRQSIAAVFFLIAFKYLIERKFLNYFLIIFAGSLFHISILILIPFYYLLAIDIKPKNIIFMFTVVLFIYISFDNIFYIVSKYILKNYNHYTTSIYWQPNSIKYLIFPTLYIISSLIFKKYSNQNDLKTTILINSAFYFFCISLFITKHFIIERFSIYFCFTSIILIPEIINKNRILTLAIIFICIMYFLFSANEGFHNVYPYFSIFDKI